MSGRVALGSSWKRVGHRGSVPAVVEDADVVVEDLAIVTPSRCSSGSRLPIVALAAAASLVLATGLAGRLLDRSAAAASAPPPRPSSEATMSASPEPLLAILIPARAEAFPDGRIQLRLLARGPVGDVHVTVSAGPAVMGSADLDVREAGQVDVEVPVLAPPFAVFADVTASWKEGTTSAVAHTPVWVWSRAGMQ